MEMWFSEFHTPDVKHSIRVNRQLFSRQSDYQRIDIFETPEFGRVLTLDGNVMLTERDEFIYDEMITHVPMAIHKEAKEIMVIGAGDGGVVRELTRYDRVRHIDLVEMDPMVVEACRAYLPENACRLDDRRVHLHYENALRFIRRCEAKYDLIIVDSSDPFGPSEGLFTREFYGNCYNALKEDGIMVNQQGSPFYAEDAHAMQRIVTISIKFTGKQSFRRTKRVRRIHDDQIIFCFASSDKSQRIFIMKMYSSVIQSAGISRKIGTTGLNNHRVHFYQINVTYSVISGQFTDNAAISGTDHQNIFCFFMDRHRHMRDHLIINKFVTICQHHISIQS